MVAHVVSPQEGTAVSWTDNSNLDTYDHSGYVDMRCPCLPAVWWLPTDADTTTTGRFFHDANVARVLRAEGGHP